MTTSDLILVSWSEVNSFRECPKKHQLNYREGWSKPPNETTALGRGSRWHEMLEAHYMCLKQGDTLAQAIVVVNTMIDQWSRDGLDPDVLDLLAWMYAGYVEHYKGDDEWEVLAVEHQYIVPLLNPDGTESGFGLKATLDLIMRNKRTLKIWLWDHKSHGDLPGMSDMDFMEQFGFYVLAMRRHGHKVHGSVYNAARTKRNQGDILEPGDPGWKSTMRKQTPEQRFARYLIARPDKELATIEHELLATCRTMYSEHNYGERHVKPEGCQRWCSYTEPCMLGRRTGDEGRVAVALQDMGFVQDAPYNASDYNIIEREGTW